MTAIEWTEKTLNLWDGCTKVDPACGYCYIERQPPLRIAGRRFERGHIPLQFHLERLEQPRRRRKPTMYFVNQLGDTFHEDAPREAIVDLWAMMADCPQHVFQVLTKRPERAREMLDPDRVDFPYQVALRRMGSDRVAWPLPNVWLGTTIGNRRWVHRADVLRETPAAVRFISAEPLLGPLIWRDCRRVHAGGGATGQEFWPSLDLSGIDWLIVGGESAGPPYRRLVGEDDRPTERALCMVRDLCTLAEIHDTAFFLKQWGGARPKSGGRELDGRTWDEFPEPAREAVGV